MSKNKIRGYIVLAVILAVFSVIAFAVPFNKTAAFWLGYVFGVIAIAYQIYVFKISFDGAEDARSKFYGFPIARVGVIYLVIQILVSLLEMALASVLLVWVAVIVNVILLGLVIIGCIAADTMREEIVRQDKVIKKTVNNMRELQSLSASMEAQCSDESAKAALQKLAESFRYSDPVSGEATTDIENNLFTMLKDTQKAMIDGDYEAVKQMKEKIVTLLDERNRICKLNK